MLRLVGLYRLRLRHTQRGSESDVRRDGARRNQRPGVPFAENDLRSIVCRPSDPCLVRAQRRERPVCCHLLENVCPADELCAKVKLRKRVPPRERLEPEAHRPVVEDVVRLERDGSAPQQIHRAAAELAARGSGRAL
eukprot:Amastigsp_a841555_73.p4 type:complete len:137 gc:universal Amastigsp_a841555_73:453-43(-)